MNDALSPLPQAGKVYLSFPDAISELTNGKLITREAWNDINEYGLLADGYLTIHTKGVFHRWTVNDGDLLATDWYVLEGKN